MACMHCLQPLRKQILLTRGLEVADFDDNDAAYKAADTILAEQRTKMPHLRQKHADKLYPDSPQLDQFWFCEFKGNSKLG